MSEEYKIQLEPFIAAVKQFEGGQPWIWSIGDDRLLQIALVERLERLVQILEQFRDFYMAAPRDVDAILAERARNRDELPPD